MFSKKKLPEIGPQEEAFEKILSAQLARNLDFVKFAETKNAALLTFSSAWIIGLVNLSNRSGLPFGYDVAFGAAILFFAIAGLICIFSFIPQLLGRFHEPEHGEKSLLYWGHIAELPVAKYHSQVEKLYKPDSGRRVTTRYLDDLSVQISVNACIAARKFSMFSVAARFVLAAFAALSIPSLLWAIHFLLGFTPMR